MPDACPWQCPQAKRVICLLKACFNEVLRVLDCCYFLRPPNNLLAPCPFLQLLKVRILVHHCQTLFAPQPPAFPPHFLFGLFEWFMSSSGLVRLLK